MTELAVGHDLVAVETLDDFLRALAVEESASEHTVRAYRTDLTHFGRFLSAWLEGRETDYRGAPPRGSDVSKRSARRDAEPVSVDPAEISAAAGENAGRGRTASRPRG